MQEEPRFPQKEKAGLPEERPQFSYHQDDLARLREREHQFLRLFERTPNPILIADRETLQFLAVNEAAVLHYGFTCEEFLSKGLVDIRPQEDVPAFLEEIAKYQVENPEFIEMGLRRHMMKDGSLLLVEIFAQATTFQQRPVWLIQVKDVTERERAQETLKLLIDVTAAAAEAQDVYAITARCLESICKLTGWPVGQAWFLDERENLLLCSSSFCSDRDIRDFRSDSLMMKVEKGVGLPGQVWQKGSPIWIDDLTKSNNLPRFALAAKAGLKAAFAFPIRDAKKLIAIFEFLSTVSHHPDRYLLDAFEKLGLHLAIVFQRKWEEDIIRHQAYHDVLTGLPNRILFKDRIAQALAHAHRNQKKLAMLFLDLDRFKMINDTHGHHVGDELLQDVSTRLAGCLREMDTIARLGGDEFMVLLPEIDQVEDAAKVAQKILGSFEPTFDIQGHKFHITTSIGISLFPHDGEDAQTLMKNADVALYRAKEKGRNNYQLYTPAMTANAVMRLNLENNLRRAIRNQEFSLHFQPQLDLRSGSIIAAEALLRWEHPALGVFMPEEFIPVAEDTGLITPIWEWALRHACLQLRDWKQARIGPQALSMNISSYQFQHSHLVPVVTQILDETGVDPHDLILEITEGMAMKADYAISLLRGFKEMGIRISIDDFGTGYSSLGQLKRFPIDYLKIDPFFVRELTTDPNDQAIVTSIITLAHGLHMQVIAEGVERIAQLNALRDLGCDAIQGFLICRPMPADQLTSRFQQGLEIPL